MSPSERRKAQKTDCLSSEMNNCQALVKPDCSKPKVLKSSGMQKALLSILTKCLPSDTCQTTEEQLSESGTIQLNQTEIPLHIAHSAKFVSVEFASMKFKTKALSGIQYLQNIEKYVLKPITYFFRNMERIVICEEKYSYTPDDFKAATRQQQQKDDFLAISHLKTGDEILSDTNFDKEAIQTKQGKSLIGTYLARHADQFSVKHNVIIDIDSEHVIGGCNREKQSAGCKCNTYAIPIRCHFTKQDGFVRKEELQNVKQRKGEAELAQVDWLSSGDIDAVLIHLFSLSFLLQRDEQNNFINPIYIILQKPSGKNDVYNITTIIRTLEKQYQDRYIAIKMALGLCVGGGMISFQNSMENLTVLFSDYSFNLMFSEKLSSLLRQLTLVFQYLSIRTSMLTL